MIHKLTCVNCGATYTQGSTVEEKWTGPTRGFATTQPAAVTSMDASAKDCGVSAPAIWNCSVCLNCPSYRRYDLCPKSKGMPLG